MWAMFVVRVVLLLGVVYWDHIEQILDTKQSFISPSLIEWNGYETRQTPLLYVFVDLKVHNVQKNSYHFDCIDQ